MESGLEVVNGDLQEEAAEHGAFDHGCRANYGSFWDSL
jgi:hypothetical protein